MTVLHAGEDGVEIDPHHYIENLNAEILAHRVQCPRAYSAISKEAADLREALRCKDAELAKREKRIAELMTQLAETIVERNVAVSQRGER